MIGFVEVDIKKIKKAYGIIKHSMDEPTPQSVDIRVERLQNALSRERRNKNMFTKKERIKVKDLLKELVYASCVSSSKIMLLRIEVASLIQDIINTKDNNDNDES